MPVIDIRTIVFIGLITNLVLTLVMARMWKLNRKHFPGTLHWLINILLQSIALILIVLRGNIPDVFSIVLSNTLVIAGALLGLIGLEKFSGLHSKHLFNYALLVVFIISHSVFTFFHPDLSLRNLNMAIAMLILNAQYVWLSFFRLKGEVRKMTTGIGIVFLGYCMVNIARLINFNATMTQQPVNEYFESGSFEAFVLIMYQTLLVALAFFVILMYNKRIMNNLVIEQEKYSRAFQTSPYAIMITRIFDGYILEVNDGFCRISGYNFDEVYGKSSYSLNLWVDESDRQVVVDELIKHGKVVNREFLFRKKSGEIITGVVSASVITVNNEKCISSSINDISKSKITEQELKLNEARLEGLLRISHYNAKSVQEFLNYALDEAIALTQSKIGYIYFYNEELQQFTLNTWSKMVMESCKIVEQETVYDLNKTGIWGEAVRQRKPIIINDFHAENPMKKGYPEGHSHLSKFLTIPVFVDNRIVAVVGVANKDSDYNDADIKQLTLMMDSVWRITEKIKIEASLKETQGILTAAMDCSQAGIAIADAPSGQIRYVNKAGLMIPGKSEEELVKEVDVNKYVSSWQIKHPDGTPFKADEVPLARAVMYGETNSREFIISRENQDNRTVLANAAPIFDDSGKVKAGVVVFLDITERKDSELKLQEKINELEKFNKIMTGRENRMIELKQEINELCGKLGIEAKYKAPVEAGRS